jgi:acetyl esterase/lipase
MNLHLSIGPATRLVAAATALASILLTASSVRAGEGNKPIGPTFEVESVLDVAYYEGLGADPVRHRLDLFLPRGPKAYPVLVFAHGGAWVFGDKSSFGLYTEVGRCLARHGVGVALINYRLSPWVRHPEHVKDVARAFAWVHKNIAKYGGSPDRLFVGGHSAGGHLAALLSTDETYLTAEQLKASAVRGVIPVSGVYRLSDVDFDLRKDGQTMRSVFSLRDVPFLPEIRIDVNLPRQGQGAAGQSDRVLHINPFGFVFSDDPKVRENAAPLAHVKPGLPPFLVVYADRDLPGLGRMAEEFAAALKAKGCEAQALRVPGRHHLSVMFRATTADDPTATAILDFINRHGG